ncbi:YraN family protein [Marinospirillum sp.]|uniref:YraN family protein n=1 Tax=Marinospirillum sp. TaxID=2183934 RepID=UPI0028707FBE|nr:YraN family protein [Marinospirillum sp.]MDR9467371.1 YraN family protein [Marinospirillum sp.]
MPAKPPTQRQLQGRAAENAACQFLTARGLQLLEQNFLCKLGEIDLILMDGQTLVFAEVRFRKNPHFGGAAASVTPSKQRKLQRAAQVYLQRCGQTPACRFDVLAMTLDRNSQLICENWIKNAF